MNSGFFLGLALIFILSINFSSFVSADSNPSLAPYCKAIRGNGELVAAHWTALAKSVENRGMPMAAAGGSSASVTLFYLDAISRNKFLSKDPLVKQRQQALLLKTIMEHKAYIWSQDSNAPDVMKAIHKIRTEKETGFLDVVQQAIESSKTSPVFMKKLGDYGPLLNPQIAAGLKRNFPFYKAQVESAIASFGDFNAKGDDMDIFYRVGLVDFKYLSILLGRVADFYAGNFVSKSSEQAFVQFLNTCGESTVGQSWATDNAKNNLCKKLFFHTVHTYYGGEREATVAPSADGSRTKITLKTAASRFANKMVFERVGSGLSVFPVTSLIKGNAVTRYQDGLKEYEEKYGTDKSVAPFSVDFYTELSYGYWGDQKQLDRIKNNLTQLFPRDLKSEKFEPLKGGSWFEVLSTSPAEPGLANFQRLPDSRYIDSNSVLSKDYLKGETVIDSIASLFKAEPNLWFDEENPKNGTIPFRPGLYSAGGWPDLSPTLVLRARGCEDVSFLTREGGESIFGQQFFIRLTGDTLTLPFWKNVLDKNRTGWGGLSATQKKTPWHQLYNLANQESSFRRSISAANSVYCTNWDAYNVKGGMAVLSALRQNAWDAPILINDPAVEDSYTYGGVLLDSENDGFPGCEILKIDN